MLLNELLHYAQPQQPSGRGPRSVGAGEVDDGKVDAGSVL